MNGLIKIIQLIIFVSKLDLGLQEVVEERLQRPDLLFGHLKGAKDQEGPEAAQMFQGKDGAAAAVGTFIEVGKFVDLIGFFRELLEIFFQKTGAAFLIGLGGRVKSTVPLPVEPDQAVRTRFLIN